MVRCNRIADVRFLLIFLSNLRTIQSVRQFIFLIRHLTYIMEQARTLGFLGIQAQFAGHHGTKISSLACMLQQILPVA